MALIQMTSGRDFAVANLREVLGEAGLGFFRLLTRVELTLHPQPSETVRLTEVVGNLKVRSGNSQKFHTLGRSISTGGPLAQEVLSRQIQQAANPQQVSLNLATDLDRRMIEAIEELRLGGDLYFLLDLWGRATVYTDPHYSEIIGYEQLTQRVNQGTWVEVLGQMGYQHTMLLEIPVPGPNAPQALSNAVGALTQAQHALIQGRYRDAVGACRDALEAFRLVMGDPPNDPALYQLFQNSNSWDKATRLQLVRRALLTLMHPARHADQVAVQHDWDRDDAVAVITMVSALMHDAK